MRMIGALVEGQTEEQFIKTVIAPHLQQRHIYIEPIIIKTKVTKHGKHFKGGINSYGQVERDLRKLPPKKYPYITTMFDVYQLPEDFPGYAEAQCYRKSPYKYVEVLEQKLAERVGKQHFIPYLSLHEFEALLFAAPHLTAQLLGIDEAYIEDILEQFTTPEEINHDKPPSKRLSALSTSRYSKVRHGIRIVKAIGIERLCATCSHFAQWVRKLESVGRV